MKSPIIRTRNTWSLLQDASTHFVRNIGLYFILSILPLMGICVGTYFAILHFNSFWILFTSLPLFLFVYGVTMHIAWESMWNAKLTFRSLMQSLLQKAIKFQVTIILFWMLQVLSTFLSLVFVLNVFKYLKTKKKLGFNTSLILLFVSFILWFICLDTFLFNSLKHNNYILLFLITIGISSIASPLLILIPPICLFEGYGPVKSFNHSVQLSYEYRFHLVPFLRMQAISGFFILIISIGINFLLKDFLGVNLPHQVPFLLGMVYTISVPFFLNMRVFYYQDLILREQGYNSLLAIRAEYKSRPKKIIDTTDDNGFSTAFNEIYFLTNSKLTK